MLKYITSCALLALLTACSQSATTATTSALNTTASAASGAAAATAGTVSTVASAVSTDATASASGAGAPNTSDATAAADATPTVAALVADVQGIVNDGDLTGADLTAVNADLAQLKTAAAAITPTSAGSAVSGFLGTVAGVLTKIGSYLPDVLPLLALVQNDGDPGFIVAVADTAPAPVKHSDPAKIASLKQHLQQLKAIAAAKVNAGK